MKIVQVVAAGVDDGGIGLPPVSGYMGCDGVTSLGGLLRAEHGAEGRQKFMRSTIIVH